MRSALWLAAGGRCQICGCDLPDGWHADHAKPWSRGGGTDFYNMRALCPQCNLTKGAKMAAGWQDYLKISAEYRQQKGQVGLWEFAASANPVRGQTELVLLPTGYGKTAAGLGAYLIFRGRGLCERLLVLVPNDAQRKQWARDAASDLSLIGGTVKGFWEVQKLERDFRAHREGRAEVFVASYQQLNDGFVRELIADGDWFLIVDECHHLPVDGLWAKRQAKLPIFFRLGMTATMLRSDRAELLEFPPRPVVQVTYKEAVRERAVRRLRGHIQHYHLELEKPGEPVIELTTEELKSRADLDRYEARRQLRYHRGYLGKIVADALQCLYEKRVGLGADNHQMVVFAMSCRHASHVAREINHFASTHGLLRGGGLSADWVGVGEGEDGERRDDDHNERILDDFKAGRLPILVQVDKAGEGFSVKTASVLLFLHLIKSDTKLIQQIGRGVRRNGRLEWGVDFCDVFASADTDLARYVEDLEQQAAEADLEDDKDCKDRKEGPTLFDIPDLVLIDATYLSTDLVGDCARADAGLVSLAAQYRLTVDELKELLAKAAQQTAPLVGAAAGPGGAARPALTEQQKLDSIAAQVERNLKTATGNVIRIFKFYHIEVVDRSTGRIMENGQLAGHVKKRLHAYWKNQLNNGRGHDAVVHGTELDRKNKWLQDITTELRASGREGVPDWLRQLILN